MQNILNELTDCLKEDERLVIDGRLVKNKIVELALALDESLIKLLLKNETIKKHFFRDIDGVLVFDKVEFQKFVSNKQFLPDSYTAFKNKIGLTANGEYLTESKEVVLAWPYKDCVLEGGQTKEDQKRKEIFWNETLAPDEIDRLLSPKVLTNFKRYDKEGEHPVERISLEDNLIIKGNNLLALESLKKVYAGKVKLIYIDPPYNTQGDANTFLYNNSFNHSTWLTFMKNRLEVSSSLMREDGVIAIAIDDEEQAYLKILCDEVFGRDNFMGTLIVQIKPSGRTTDAYFATCHEYVLFYSKHPNHPNINFFDLPENQKKNYSKGDIGKLHKWRDFLRTGGYSTPEERPNSYYPIYYNPNNQDISLENKGGDYIEILPIDTSGNKRVWRKTPKSFSSHLKKGEIQIAKKRDGTYKVQLIDYIKEGVRPKSIWIDSKYDASSHGTKLLKNIFNGDKVFSFPKSLYSVKDVIDIFTERGGDDLVIDFFAGSGTTGHAVLELNEEDGGSRRFILCEQLAYADSVTSLRVRKVIEELESDDNFIVLELFQNNEIFINQLKDNDASDEIVKIHESIMRSGFISYRINPKTINDSISEFEELSLDEQKRFLIELLDKNQLYVNYSEIDDKDFAVSDEDKELNHQFYSLK